MGRVLISRRRDPDRLLPADPTLRSVARELYALTANLPILSPHGHVPAALLLHDEPFANATELFLTHDHYVTRLLHADGVGLAELGLGERAADPREVWRLLAERWHLFAGTATGYWIDEELSGLFGVEEPLCAETADSVYDAVAAALAEPAFRPRALFGRFGIEVLATTDDPLDDLANHAALATSGLPGRVIPTFRPDAYLNAASPGFAEAAGKLLAATGQPATFAGYLRGLEERRRHFIEHGATSADHGVVRPVTVALEPGEAERLFRAALSGAADARERDTLAAHLLWQMARMSVEDGLVMTIHAGVFRNHNSHTHERFGPDTGHDIPLPTSWVEGLRPLLESFGLEPGFQLGLFTVDESTFSRELAPLAGFYPSVYVGAPWWFLDAPHAIDRFRSAVTETAGFYRTTGFIDDTRAFASIPARHDMSRRTDAAFLARLVVEGRVHADDARRIAVDLVDAQPRRVFKL
ncbi:glucuronate isomerase [Prauserella endophytica]|uniref:Uronate isomerase n=1 Tax=Prauserella endophytica TaxID=1592324 RepID=A0ABY2S626_9PSEU|nr:glucuronate isomerase [Prauserella coralliicola]TKG70921.1 glucuronate isomerase [Prauserella endophytica]